MHAALISLVLMSGACGDAPTEEILTAPPIESVLAPSIETVLSPSHAPIPAFFTRAEVTVSVPPVLPHGCAACDGHSVPPLYQTCPEHYPAELRTTPAWKTRYKPACYFYPRHRMLLHPADYTEPYPYRERFNYPWNDPRCPCAALPLGR